MQAEEKEYDATGGYALCRQKQEYHKQQRALEQRAAEIKAAPENGPTLGEINGAKTETIQQKKMADLLAKREKREQRAADQARHKHKKKKKKNKKKAAEEAKEEEERLERVRLARVKAGREAALNHPANQPAKKAQRKDRGGRLGNYTAPDHHQNRRLVEVEPTLGEPELQSPSTPRHSEGTPRHSEDTPRNTEGTISPDLVQVVDLSSSSPVVTGAGFAAVVLIPCFLAYRLMKCWGKRKQFERPAISEDVGSSPEDRV